MSCEKMSIEEILCSYDVEWLAVDKVGHVAVFYSFSIAPVPHSSSMHLEEFSALAVKWKRDFISHGIIEYDAEGDFPTPCSTYKRLQSPNSPAHIDDFPSQLRALFQSTKFSQIDFTEEEFLSPMDHLPCREATTGYKAPAAHNSGFRKGT